MTHVFERLIVPLDGSQASLAATNLAIRMALASDAEVTFAHAINRAAIVAECTSVYGGDAGMALDELDEYGKSILEEAKALAEGRGVRARALLLDGAPAHAIVTLATGNGADAIVMGTARKSALEHLFLGSTAVGVIRAATIPTFVVHAAENDGSQRGLFRNIFAAIDRSAAASSAADYAIALAKAFESRLTFYHVAEPADMVASVSASGGLSDAAHVASEQLVADACAKAKALDVDAESFVTDGKPSDVLVGMAVASGADLVVIGTHGRAALEHLVFGSVAERVVRLSTIPVVVLRLPVRAATHQPATA